LHRSGPTTILEPMGELKSCLFCGKNVDSSFQYCPHCGYEFGQGEDKSAEYHGDKSAEYHGDKSAEYHGDKSAEYHGELPALVEVANGELIPEAEEDYLLRIRTLQELLSDMEKELDLIIRTSSKDP
jgi:hypothetical protein